MRRLYKQGALVRRAVALTFRVYMAVYDFVRIAHSFYGYSFYFVFYGAISCARYVAYLHNVAVKVVVLAPVVLGRFGGCNVTST